MADPNPNSSLSSSYPVANPPGPPGPDVFTPPSFHDGMGGYRHPYDPPPYRHPYAVHPNQYSSGLSDTYQGVTSPVQYSHFHHQIPAHGPWPLMPGHRANVYPHSQLPQFSNQSRNLQTPSMPHSEIPDGRNHGALPPMIEPFMPGVPTFMRDFTYTTPPQMHNYPYPGRRTGYNSPAIPVSLSSREMSSTPQSTPHVGGVSRGVNSNAAEQPRVLASPPRRPSYDRQNQEQASNGAERRSANYVDPHSRRSDRSVSPRTSNRRSFDRYSSDSQGSPDAVEALSRARVLQRRRVRERAMSARHSHMYADGNTPTSQQMQILKDKLRHLLPSQLPEDASSCCDICQKDYSAKYCDPSEEDEVAIQLPCKHIFGEHCINTWFETCKTHKNKITCPMCRKLLIEHTSRNLASVASVMPEMLAFFSRPGSGIAGMGHAEQQAIAHLMRARELEGDF